MDVIQTIVLKAQTDGAFYKALATDFNKAISPYNLSLPQVETLKPLLKNVRPPAGLKGFDDPILAFNKPG